MSRHNKLVAKFEQRVQGTKRVEENLKPPDLLTKFKYLNPEVAEDRKV
jgi:hypothetical protein